jgi:hypothetical protein
MLKLDGAFNQNVTMTLEPTGYASQYLSKAYTILTGQLAMVCNGCVRGLDGSRIGWM